MQVAHSSILSRTKSSGTHRGRFFGSPGTGRSLPSTPAPHCRAASGRSFPCRDTDTCSLSCAGSSLASSEPPPQVWASHPNSNSMHQCSPRSRSSSLPKRLAYRSCWSSAGQFSPHCQSHSSPSITARMATASSKSETPLPFALGGIAASDTANPRSSNVFRMLVGVIERLRHLSRFEGQSRHLQPRVQRGVVLNLSDMGDSLSDEELAVRTIEADWTSVCASGWIKHV